MRKLRHYISFILMAAGILYYYYQVEAFNENGISGKSEILSDKK